MRKSEREREKLVKNSKAPSLHSLSFLAAGGAVSLAVIYEVSATSIYTIERAAEHQ